MPELPEVESVRASLERRVLGCEVSGVIVRRRDVIATPDDPAGGFGRQRANRAQDRSRLATARTVRPAKPTKTARPGRVDKADLLVGDTIASVRRHGKQLALVGSSGRCVLIHLGMTGEVMAPGPGARLRAADHLHVLWTLRRADDRASAGRMVFRDPRRFGGVWTLPGVASLSERWRALGTDGLDVTAGGLSRAAGRSERMIKAALLDQRVVAGVGNIYADESLHRAGIHPMAIARSLDDADWQRLAAQIRQVLAEAVALGGSTLRDYRDAEGTPGTATSRHRVYGRSGKPCPTCGSAIISETVAQRTTAWCPVCQPHDRATAT